MEKLFSKTYAELREAFVRARFAEQQYYSRPDIEVWLTGQRTAERPGVAGWNRYLAFDGMRFAARNREFVLLRQLGYRLRDAPLPKPCTDNADRRITLYRELLPLLSSLRDAEIYFDHSSGLTVIVNKGTMSAYTFEAGNLTKEVPRIVLRRTLSSHAVVDSIYASWLYDGEKAHQARAFLCDALAQVIAGTRQSAEEEFVKAVAVSADGTKIVHADSVIVVGFATEELFHCADNRGWFRQEKILRGPVLLRREGVVRVLRCGGRKALGKHDQILASGGKGMGKRVLITRAKYVPGGNLQLIGAL